MRTSSRGGSQVVPAGSRNQVKSPSVPERDGVDGNHLVGNQFEKREPVRGNQINAKSAALTAGRVLSASIVQGAKTNRVRVKARQASAGTAKARFRKDPSTRGLDCAVVCISLPVAELVALDAVADRAQMARSHFLREAAKHFTAYLEARKPT